MSCDLLILEWSSKPGRDVIPTVLVSNCLETCGFKVVVGSIFKAVQLIRTCKPRAVFLNYVYGSSVGVALGIYCKRIGLPLFTYMSEGNIRQAGLAQSVWGNNESQEDLADSIFVWSSLKKQIIAESYPKLSEKLHVSGSMTADAIKIFGVKSPRTDKKERLVIGLACWNFGIVYESDSRFENSKRAYGDEGIQRFRKERWLFRSVIKKTIEELPNVKFLVKEHPSSELGQYASAIEGLDIYDNVEIVSSSLSMDQVISQADIWLSYESVTALESWLLDKPSIMVKPLGAIIPGGHNAYEGQPVVNSSEHLVSLIREFEISGNITEFNKLEAQRHKILSETFGKTDGLNYARLAEVLASKIIHYPKIHISFFNSGLLRARFIRLTKYVLCLLFSNFNKRLMGIKLQQFDSFNTDEFYMLKNSLRHKQMEFHQKVWSNFNSKNNALLIRLVKKDKNLF